MLNMSAINIHCPIILINNITIIFRELNYYKQINVNYTTRNIRALLLFYLFLLILFF